MEPVPKTKNVKGVEAVLRFIMGVVLVISFFTIRGIPRWLFGFIGVAFILTAIFGY